MILKCFCLLWNISYYLLLAKVKAKFIVIVVLLQNIHAIIEIIIVCFLSFGDKFRNLQSYISWFGIKILENYTNLFVKYSKTCLGCCLNRSKLHNIKKILYMQSINSINSKKKQWFFNTCISSFLTIFWILQLRVWLVYISALEKFLKLLNCAILIWKKWNQYTLSKPLKCFVNSHNIVNILSCFYYYRLMQQKWFLIWVYLPMKTSKHYVSYRRLLLWWQRHMLFKKNL